MALNLLDCTFRDGGYYTNWDFPSGLVDSYVDAVNSAGLQYVEIGFRNFPDSVYRGAFYYSPDEYISQLGVAPHVKIFVMVDASSFRGLNSLEAGVKQLFQVASQTCLHGVRIATRVTDLDLSLRLAELLNRLGYRVFINLMQVAAVEYEVLKVVIEKISASNNIDVIYFADSLGEMLEREVGELIHLARRVSNKSIGFHAHNNLGLGVANALAAANSGAEWLDATITGMGRGAGNAETENMLLALPQLVSRPREIAKSSLLHFVELKKKHNWGSSYLYALAAKKKIHPTFIQELQSQPGFSPERALDVIDYLAKIDARSFDKDLLNFTKEQFQFEGQWIGNRWCEGREVIILGGGPSLEEHAQGVSFYIKKNNPLVISLACSANSIDESLLDYYACANETKIAAEHWRYPSLEKPIFLSTGFFESVSGDKICKIDNIDYGLRVAKGCFDVHQSYCVIPSQSSAAYALAICILGKAKRVGLVGFDGLGDEFSDQSMQEVFDLAVTGRSLTLFALTPTKYHLEKRSLYAIYK